MILNFQKIEFEKFQFHVICDNSQIHYETNVYVQGRSGRSTLQGELRRILRKKSELVICSNILSQNSYEELDKERDFLE